MSNLTLPVYHKLSGDEASFACPKCKCAKFSYNIVSHKGQCWVCGFSVQDQAQLQRLLEYYDIDAAEVEAAPKLRKLYDRGTFLPALSVPEAAAYLEKRRVSPQAAMECGALWQDPYIRFPIWSPFGAPLMTQGRNIRPDAKIRWDVFPGDRGRYVFGKLPKDGRVVVTEGVFHGLSSGLWGHCVSILGKVCTVDLAVWMLQTFSIIVLWLDVHEEEGNKAQDKLKGLLEGMRKVVGANCAINDIRSNRYPPTKELGDHTFDEVAQRVAWLR